MKLSDLANSFRAVFLKNYQIDLTPELIPHFDYRVGHLYSDCCQKIAEQTRVPPAQIAGVVQAELVSSEYSFSYLNDFLNIKLSDQAIKDLIVDQNYRKKNFSIYLPAASSFPSSGMFLRLAAIACYQKSLAELINCNVTFYYKQTEVIADEFFSDSNQVNKFSFASLEQEVDFFSKLTGFDYNLFLFPVGQVTSKQFDNFLAKIDRSNFYLQCYSKDWLKLDHPVSSWDSDLVLYLASNIPGRELDLVVPSLSERANFRWWYNSVINRAHQILPEFTAQQGYFDPELTIRTKLLKPYLYFALQGKCLASDDNLKAIIDRICRFINDPDFRNPNNQINKAAVNFLSGIIKELQATIGLWSLVRKHE